MTDTPTAPTLRELLDQHDMHISPDDRLCIPKADVEEIETSMLTPFRAEIAVLRTRVANDDTFRERACTFVSNAISDPYLLEQWGYITAPYYVAPVAEANLTGIPERSIPVTAPVGEDVKPMIRPTVKSDANELDKQLARGSLSPSPMHTDDQLATMHDTPPAVAPVGEDTKPFVIVPEMHWGTMKSQLMGWMGTYTMFSNMTDIHRASNRAKVAWFLACKLTGEKVEHDDLADDDEGIPPAVADAGETGEDEDSRDRQFDIRLAALEDWRERSIPKRAEMKKDLLRIAYGQKSATKHLAALRRDVDALKLEVRDATCTIVDTRDGMIGGLADRIERLESRERPESDNVTGEMIESGARELEYTGLNRPWGNLSYVEKNYLRVKSEKVLRAALAAKDGGT